MCAQALARGWSTWLDRHEAMLERAVDVEIVEVAALRIRQQAIARAWSTWLDGLAVEHDDEARKSATRTKMARIRGAWNRLAGRRSSAHRDVHHDLAVGVLDDFNIDIHGDT